MGDYNYRESEAAWASDDQWECCEFLRDLFGGFHHMRLENVKDYGMGIAYSIRYPQMATADNSQLTRMVFMAHDRMIRVELNGSGPAMIKLCLWKRHKREGQLRERHATVEDALALHRQHHESLPETVTT